jgi:Fe2+ or Zn2+ uptake regulation protein
MSTEQELHIELKKLGIRPSIQRIAVMDFLIKNPIHPTIDEIYNELSKTMPTLSKTTVYNTVKTLSENKAIQTIFIDDKNKRYDADTNNHVHFMCNNCGEIIDLPIKSLEIKTEGDENLTVTEYHFYYRGYCSKCKN